MFGSAYEFDASIWCWRDGVWHFVSVPEDVTDEIEDRVAVRAGFGSVKVEATVGASTWRTSIFPSKELRTFILPLKKSIRAAERCAEGDVIRVRMTIES